MQLTCVMSRYVEGSIACLKAAYVTAMQLYKGTVTFQLTVNGSFAHGTGRDTRGVTFCKNRMGGARTEGVARVLSLTLVQRRTSEINYRAFKEKNIYI